MDYFQRFMTVTASVFMCFIPSLMSIFTRSPNISPLSSPIRHTTVNKSVYNTTLKYIIEYSNGTVNITGLVSDPIPVCEMGDLCLVVTHSGKILLTRLQESMENRIVQAVVYPNIKVEIMSENDTLVTTLVGESVYPITLSPISFNKLYVKVYIQEEFSMMQYADKRLDELVIIDSHNSQSIDFDKGQLDTYANPLDCDCINVANQGYSVEVQLAYGVRSLKLPLEYINGNIWVAHSYILDKSKMLLLDFIEQKVKVFLNTHPNDILVLRLNPRKSCQDDNYAPAMKEIVDILRQSGITTFTKRADESWPTIRQLVESDRRLLVFNVDNEFQMDERVMTLPTDYTLKTVEQIRNEDVQSKYNKDNGTYYYTTAVYPAIQYYSSALIVANHGITPWGYTAGKVSIAWSMNQYNEIYHRMLRLKQVFGRVPTFIDIDFIHVPYLDAFHFAHDYNMGYITL